MLKLALLVVFSSILQLGYSQKDVHLKINHLLGAAPFALNQTATNNLGNEFKTNRLQYYISGIVLHHDGTQTDLPDTYILADASVATNELLGSFNITVLDSITIGIGVDSVANHSDPTARATGHALAPQSPSMHWSWSSGYRFVAFEGIVGSTSDAFTMHATDDVNYFTQTIVTNGQTTGNNIDVVLNADYLEGVRDITVDKNLNSHGGTGACQILIENFRTRVFSAPTATSITDLPTLEISLYPNPVKLGEVMQIETVSNEDLDVQVYDLSGKLFTKVCYNATAKTLQFSERGLYVVQVIQDKKIIATRRVQVGG